MDRVNSAVDNQIVDQKSDQRGPVNSGSMDISGIVGVPGYRWRIIEYDGLEKNKLDVHTPFGKLAQTKHEIKQKVIQKNRQISTYVLENYMLKIKKDINSEFYKLKDKKGKIIRYYTDGGIVYCTDLNNYATVNGFDKDSGTYFIKIKNKELEQRVQ